MTTDTRHTFAPILAGPAVHLERDGRPITMYLPPTDGAAPVFVAAGSVNRPSYRFALSVPSDTLANHLAAQVFEHRGENRTPSLGARVTFSADLSQN